MPYPVSAARGHWTGAAASAGWWIVAGQTCVAAYQPKGAADLAASYVNLANPGVLDLSASAGTVTFATATGWTFDGTTSLKTAGTTTLTITHTLAVRFVTPASWTQQTPILISMRQASPIRTFDFVPRHQSLANKGHLQAYNGSWGTLQTSGVLSMNTGYVFVGTMAANALAIYLNGSPDASGAGLASIDGTVKIGIGNSAASNDPNQYMQGSVQAAAIYSGTLSAGEIASLTTAMNAL